MRFTSQCPTWAVLFNAIMQQILKKWKRPGTFDFGGKVAENKENQGIEAFGRRKVH
jgi:hypothetical protein